MGDAFGPRYPLIVLALRAAGYPLLSLSHGQRDHRIRVAAYLWGMARRKMDNFVIAKRRRLGWSQADVAERIGVKPVTVARLEANVLTTSMSTLQAYLQLLGYKMSFWPTVSRPPGDQAT